MKINTAVLCIGIVMVVGGFAASGMTQDLPGHDRGIDIAKHGGTFAGLLGVGACIAGTLLHIIDRYQVAV